MKLGIGILGFDRPHYLRQLLASLERNDTTNCDFWLFQDGATSERTGKVRAHKELIDENVEAFKAALLPNKQLVHHRSNIGVGPNRMSLLSLLSSCYDGFIALEDDVVVSESFIPLARKLLGQFALDEDIALIRSPLVPIEFTSPNGLNQRDAHISAMFTLKTWILPVLRGYREYFSVIRAFDYFDHVEWHELAEKFLGQRVTSSDGALEWAAKREGKICWTMAAPRAKSLGREGMHFNPQLYESMRMHEVNQIVYPGELTETWSKTYGG